MEPRGQVVMEPGVRPGGEAPARRIALVADDEPGIRDLLAEVLDALGFHTLTAGNGIELMELVDRVSPSLIVIDVMMPRMDGYTAVTRLRGQAATERVPIIVLTGRTDPSYGALSDGVGANAHITKPFSPQRLVEAVHRLVGDAVP